MEGYSKLYYPSGKLASVATFKKWKSRGNTKRLLWKWKKLREKFHIKNGLVDGVSKLYYPNGKVQNEITHKRVYQMVYLKLIMKMGNYL